MTRLLDSSRKEEVGVVVEVTRRFGGVEIMRRVEREDEGEGEKEREERAKVKGVWGAVGLRGERGLEV